MISRLAVTLLILGPALGCVGVVIQYFASRKRRQSEEKVSAIREFIERLGDSIDELRKLDKTRGMKTMGGFDIGEIIEIMQKGTEAGHKQNRKIMLALMDERDKSLARCDWSEKIGVWLVIAGIIVSGVAAFLVL
jgi:hypothetical protein